MRVVLSFILIVPALIFTLIAPITGLGALCIVGCIVYAIWNYEDRDTLAARRHQEVLDALAKKNERR